MFNPNNSHKIRPIISLAVLLSLIILFTPFSYIKAEKNYFPQDILTDLNQERMAFNVKPLIFDARLNQAAFLKADNMFSQNYFDHFHQGITPWDFIIHSGYNYRYAGENLAINYTDADEVTVAWMNSATHRKNMLNENFDHAGITIQSGEINGKPATITVLMLGREKNNTLDWFDIPLTQIISQLLGA